RRPGWRKPTCPASTGSSGPSSGALSSSSGGGTSKVAERELKPPALGEGLTGGEVVRWLVAEGEAIALNQPIVEGETAKAVGEIPAPYAGTVVKLHAAQGDPLDVGAPLISVDTGGGAAPAADAPPPRTHPHRAH